MNDEPDLFSLAYERAQAGIDRSAGTAGDDWGAYALEFLRKYLVTHVDLFSDDLWNAGLREPASPRALGAVILTAARNGWIEEQTTKTAAGETAFVARKSVRSNLGLKPVWRSRIYRAPEPDPSCEFCMHGEGSPGNCPGCRS